MRPCLPLLASPQAIRLRAGPGGEMVIRNVNYVETQASSGASSGPGAAQGHHREGLPERARTIGCFPHGQPAGSARPPWDPDPRPTALSEEARVSAPLPRTVMEARSRRRPVAAGHRCLWRGGSHCPASRGACGVVRDEFGFPPSPDGFAVTSWSGIKNKRISHDPGVRRLNEADCGFAFSIFQTQRRGDACCGREVGAQPASTPAAPVPPASLTPVRGWPAGTDG